MSLDLSYIGLQTFVVLPRLSTAYLGEKALKRGEVQMLHNFALSVRTSPTGRSPKDRFIVDDAVTHQSVAWGSVNRPIKKHQFERLFEHAKQYIKTQEVYVQDVFCGADPHYRLSVRFVGTHAVQAIFVRNMFLLPSEAELEAFSPQWHVIAVPNAAVDSDMAKECGLKSGNYVLMDFTNKIVLIGGTSYCGEIKKSIFAVMNYELPERNVLPMHSSVNVNADDKVTIFFGLSGTGKTTLALDPETRLLGDDEHGWGPEGVFNFEGGCYAKTIDLKQEDEPWVYDATERANTTVENVAFDPLSRRIDYADGRLTENGRASFSIDAIPNAIVEGVVGHPDCIIFLTCDAYGVLPPVARLTPAQAAYHFGLGYTAKVAGTEKGIDEPVATFSALFGEPFFPLPHKVYTEKLAASVEEHSVPVWLVNTGWTGGPYGTGHRISIADTRNIVRAVQNGGLDAVEMTTDPVFGFRVPTSCPLVKSHVLNPQSTWSDAASYDEARLSLARQFIDKAETLDLSDLAREGGPLV